MIDRIVIGFVFSILVLSSVGFAQTQTFERWLEQAKNLGIFEIFLPFLLVFAVFWGLLNKTQIFSVKDKNGDVVSGGNINLVFATAIAAFVVIATPVGTTIGTFLSDFASQWLVILLTFIVVLIIISLSEGKIIPTGSMLSGKGIKVFIAFIVLIAVGVIISSGGTGVFPGFSISNTPFKFLESFNLRSSTTLVYLIIGTAIIIFWATRSDSKKRGSGSSGGPSGQSGP